MITAVELSNETDIFLPWSPSFGLYTPANIGHPPRPHAARKLSYGPVAEGTCAGATGVARLEPLAAAAAGPSAYPAGCKCRRTVLYLSIRCRFAVDVSV